MLYGIKIKNKKKEENELAFKEMKKHVRGGYNRELFVVGPTQVQNLGQLLDFVSGLTVFIGPKVRDNFSSISKNEAQAKIHPVMYDCAG